MKLETIVLTGFRSVKGTEKIHIDDKIAILIGANDHGKSNILEAIRALNDDRHFTDDDRNWDLPPDKEVRVEWHFKLNEEETLTTLIDLLKQEEQVEESPEEESEEDKETHLNPDELDENTRNELSRILVLEPSVLSETDKEFLRARWGYLTEEQRGIFAEVGLDDKEFVDETEAEGAKESEEPEKFLPQNKEGKLVLYKEGIGSQVKVLSVPSDNIPEGDEEYVLKLRPRVELFEAPKSNLVDRVNKKQLETLDYEFMQGIFRLAGLWDHRDKIFTDDVETSRLLDEASERLTKELNEKWNQGKDLKWMLKPTGTNGNQIEIRIKDPSISNRYTLPSVRSSGFKTYFLTSMIISARVANNQSHSYIYLFDEPGIFLHPHAQLDLQRAYEKIADNSQIVYTTHSLFLINKNNLNRNKVISKTAEGTKINQKPYLNNWKSVRESLGILLSNNFLIADKTLVTEGPSDVIFILDTIRRLKENGKVDIDLNDFSVVDAGNSQNYVSITKLMLSEGREIVALMDGDASGSRIKVELEKVCEKEIRDEKLVILPLDPNKSIEDYCVDIKYLRESIKKVVNNLVTLGVRTLKPSLKLDEELKRIKRSKSKTLGRVMEEVLGELFEPKDRVSKLSIAAQYEDLVKGKSVSVSDSAFGLIKDIQEKANLKGEKSAEAGVFEEAK